MFGMQLWKHLYEGDKPIVTSLIGRCRAEDLNILDPKTGEGMLHHAVLTHDTVLLEQLLKRGANPDLQNIKGGTAMMIAVIRSNVEMVSIILNYKPTVDLKDFKGRTALMLAIKHRVYEAVRLLIEAKANILMEDDSEKTVEDYVKAVEDVEIERILKYQGRENDYLRLVVDFEDGPRTAYVNKDYFEGCNFKDFVSMRIIVPPDLMK